MKSNASSAWAAIFILAGTLASCSKTVPLSNTTASTVSDASSTLIYTPFGVRRRSDVIMIESTAKLRFSGGHLIKVDKQTGKVLQDFGKQLPLDYVQQQKAVQGIRKPLVTTPGVQAPGITYGSGWITDAANAGLDPVTYFSTSWTVPTAPTLSSGLLYLFNGLQDGFTSTSHILQPVLQYGNNGGWGGAYWVVDNWFASCQSCTAYYGSPVTVSAGTSLTGVMQQTGVSGGVYSYTSSFSGSTYAAASVSVDDASPLIYPFETLECYNITSASNYPTDSKVSMTGINIQTASGYPSLSWGTQNFSTELGQHTVVVSNSNPGGQVDIYFNYPKTGTGTWSFNHTTTTHSGTITGFPGQYISMTLDANGRPGVEYELSVSISGSTFGSTGTGGLIVDNGSITDGFYLPASGTVTWSAYFGTTGLSGSGSLDIQ